MPTKSAISIVIPTLNEVDNVPAMMARIDAAMSAATIPYEVIIVDDHSTDGTMELAQTLISKYPLSLYTKRGKRGKAYSLLEGFELASNELIVMIDADLQYPPEEIVPMYQLMNATNADVVVTNRVEKNVSALRKLSTKVFNLIFARLLFGIKFDTQSGQKLFKKKILSSFSMTPSPWSFDLEFLVRALENNYTIVSHDIPFAERSHGDTKVRLIGVAFELAKASLQLRWRTSASRVRAGHQANNRFLERALQMLVITGLLTIIGLATVPGRSAAISVSTTPVTASILDYVPFLNNDTKQSSSTPTVPTSPVTTNPTTNVSTSPTETTTESATNRTSSTNSNSATAGSTTAVATSSRTAVATIPDQSGLRAATAATGNSAYKDTYPNYRLSTTSQQRLFDGAQLAIIAGLICLIAAIIMSGISVRRTSPVRVRTNK